MTVLIESLAACSFVCQEEIYRWKVDYVIWGYLPG